MTINELLVLMKTVRARRNELVALRSDSATSTRYYGASESVKDPKYDIKLLDKKITMMENWLFKVDAAIKISNAKTHVDLEVNVDELLAPLE